MEFNIIIYLLVFLGITIPLTYIMIRYIVKYIIKEYLFYTLINMSQVNNHISTNNNIMLITSILIYKKLWTQALIYLDNYYQSKQNYSNHDLDEYYNIMHNIYKHHGFIILAEKYKELQIRDSRI